MTFYHQSLATAHTMTSKNIVVYHLRKHALNQFSHLDSYKMLRKKPTLFFSLPLELKAHKYFLKEKLTKVYNFHTSIYILSLKDPIQVNP